MGGASTKPKDFCCSQATWFLDPIGVGGGHLMSLNTIESLSLSAVLAKHSNRTGRFKDQSYAELFQTMFDRI